MASCLTNLLPQRRLGAAVVLVVVTVIGVEKACFAPCSVQQMAAVGCVLVRAALYH